jgi:hypothetical protein
MQAVLGATGPKRASVDALSSASKIPHLELNLDAIQVAGKCKLVKSIV